MDSCSCPTGGLTDQQCIENLVTRLSHRPAHLTGGMISINEPVKPSSLQSRPSSLPTSVLEATPVEVLHLVLSELDFQSLSRFSRVSHRCKAVTESLPAYIDLLAYASYALKALGLTRLLYLHSARTLHVALQSEQCVSCREFGPFLFLPTCERCCYECLFQNQSLWVVPTSLAGKYFGLTPRQVKTLPVMESIPGVYSAISPAVYRRRSKLVSVKAAKTLAIRANGSDTPFPEADTRNGESTDAEFYTIKYFRNAPLQPLPENPSRLRTTGKVPRNKYWGMASIVFPSRLTNSTPEYGLWCRECEWRFEQYRLGQLPYHVVSESEPQGIDPFIALLRMRRRARTRTEFREHMKCCYDVQKLLPSSVTEAVEHK